MLGYLYISTKDDPLQLPAKLNNTFRFVWAPHPFPTKAKLQERAATEKSRKTENTRSLPVATLHCGGKGATPIGKSIVKFRR